MEDLTREGTAELFAARRHDPEFPLVYPLTFAKIQHCQERDQTLLNKLSKDNGYTEELYPFGEEEYCLITKDGKIVLPKALQYHAVQWYHVHLMHPGETHTELTMSQHYTWVGMQNTVQAVCQRCPSCQLMKTKTLKYGHLPPKQLKRDLGKGYTLILLAPT